MVDARAELDALIRAHGEDYASVSRLIGRNPAYIQQFIKRGTPQRLAEEDRARLAAYFAVPEERLGGRTTTASITIVPDKADMLMIPRIDIEASAGPGGLAEIEAFRAPVVIDRSLLRGVSAGSGSGLSVIRVAGDSMEPTLRDGDDIVVDRNDGAARMRDGIYVLRIDTMLMVKRLMLEAGAARPLVIRSDNPRYPDIADYDPASLAIIGRVLWMGRSLG